MDGYQLKILVLGSIQPIWRRVEVPAEMIFLDLHCVIQEVFGLADEFIFGFDLGEMVVASLGDNIVAEFDHKVILCNEKIVDYIEEGMVFNYLYDLENDCKFQVVVEKKLVNVDKVARVIDYCGSNLIELYDDINNCSSLDRKIREEIFDLDLTNENLKIIEVEEVINNSSIKKEFNLYLNQLKKELDKRDIVTYQVIELKGTATVYWVIVKTIEGYAVELFESYENLLEGFYNLQTKTLNHAFCNCYTFLLANEAIDIEQPLDDENKIAALYNQSGYLSCLIKLEDGILVLEWLKELLVGLAGDFNTSEVDEIIEINVEGNRFKESSIYVHETQISIDDFDLGYRGKEKLCTSLTMFERVCLDIVCLPTSETYLTSELQMYAIIATKEDYVMKEIFFPDKSVMCEALVDIIVDFFNQNGRANRIIVNNLNVLFLIIGFLNDNEIGYLEDDTSLEIDSALADAFGFNEDLINDPFMKNLLNEFEGKSEEEIEILLDELLNKNELLN